MVDAMHRKNPIEIVKRTRGGAQQVGDFFAPIADAKKDAMPTVASEEAHRQDMIRTDGMSMDDIGETVASAFHAGQSAAHGEIDADPNTAPDVDLLQGNSEVEGQRDPVQQQEATDDILPKCAYAGCNLTSWKDGLCHGHYKGLIKDDDMISMDASTEGGDATSNEEEASRWNAAGAKRTPEDIAASRQKSKEMGEKADREAAARKGSDEDMIETGDALTVPEQHQLRIAKETLKMNPAMAAVAGGPSMEEARRIVAELTAKAGPSKAQREKWHEGYRGEL
jgi:hypothetical protein